MSGPPRRRLAAVMFTDIAGYTALMQEDEESALRARSRHREAVERALAVHRGRIWQFQGDGSLSVFRSALDAVLAAVDILRDVAAQPSIPLRIGLHQGDIARDSQGIYGDSVNVASRLQTLAPIGGLLVSDKIYDEIKNQRSLPTLFVGEVALKNVARPLPVYAVAAAGLAVPKAGDLPCVPAEADERGDSESVASNGPSNDRGGAGAAAIRLRWRPPAKTDGARRGAAPAPLTPARHRFVSAVLVGVALIAGGALVADRGFDNLAAAFGVSNGLLVALVSVVIAVVLLAVLLHSRLRILSKPGRSGQSREVLAGDGGAHEPVEHRSVAVLPFVDMSPGQDHAYFGAGIGEELINALSHVPGLRVASRTSSFVLHAKGEDIREIGSRLRVATILDGSVRKAGDRLRITAQLIGVAAGDLLWSETYDREARDVLAIQDEITRSIVETLKPKFAGSDFAAGGKQGTTDPDAYHLYIKGRYFWYLRNISKALDYFEQASVRDLTYALPHAGIADAHAVLAHYGFEPSTIACQRARLAAERAVALDPAYAEGVASLALTETYFGWDFPSAEKKFRRALELNPSLALVHGWLGILNGWSGRPEDAVAEAQLAEKLEPLSPLISCTSCIAYFYAGRFDESIAVCRRGLELAPQFGPLLWCLGLPLTTLHQHEEAIEATERALELMNGAPWVAMLLGERYARGGRPDDARKILESLEKRDYVPFLSTAWIRLWLGDHDAALAAMENAFAAREAMAWFWGNWPGLDLSTLSSKWRTMFARAGVVPLGSPAHPTAASHRVKELHGSDSRV